ncbi:hypothetical protein EW145_g3294 [Phellinidium pouzarii]|uniref:alcohol dehydrogenase (NADP(+)) n=1 Tax=Phellinidium pouzarii TaxID=167371 RepID=A0A4S4LCY7_9AGAM|nr:hypothetical protein EW145_g3294 [Phellinidium pouzarii]
MASSQKTFKGYGVTNPNHWSDFKVIDYPAKNWEETDVEVAITHCGVCGSDVHTLTGGWGALKTPMIVGHEIVGTAVRVGSKVKGIKKGDRVGIGAQIGSCYSCRQCKNDNENYCLKKIDTYASQYPDGVRTQGGFANGIIANEQYVFPIPDGLSSANVASMLCAGLTVFSPLKRNGAGPGKKVGVIGMGGLGHYAVIFAKAMGADVYVFSSSTSKREDAKKMGADHFVCTSDGNFTEDLRFTLDLIISTRDAEDFPFEQFLPILDVHGMLISVGLADNLLPQTSIFNYASNGSFFGGSHIGSKKEALEMLALATEKNIKPWIEEIPMKDAKRAVEGVKANKAHFRYVLVQDIN